MPFRLSLPLLSLLVFSALLAPVRAVVVINEILYRPAGTPEDTGEEFLELHNPGPTPVGLAGWKFDRGVSFTFPAGTTLPAGGYLIVASDPSKFGGTPNVFGPWTGSLSNTAEEVRLVNLAGVPQDSVKYASEGDWARRVRDGLGGWDWQSLADDGGHSLERRNPNIPTDNGQNWAFSAAPGGTPSAPNAALSSNVAPVIRDVEHRPASPRSSDTITFLCNLVDETAAPGLSATLHWRDASTATPGEFETVAMTGDGAGNFRATLPPMAHRTLVEFYISATDGTNTRTYPAPTNEGQNANAVLQVDDEVVPGTDEIYRIVMTAAENTAYETLAATNPNSDRQFNCTLVTLRHAQSSIRYSTSFRIRGASSRGYQFKPLRIAVPSDNKLDGVRVFNLNPKWPWNQYLGMKLLQAAGLRSPDARPVEVRRNGVEYTTGGSSARDYGKWVRMDHLDADFVDKHWPEDSNGNLYKKVRPDNSWAYRNGNIGQYQSDGWTKESNTAANDWSDLDALMQRVRAIRNAHGGAVWDGTPATTSEVNQLGDIADLPQWIRWLAIENFMGNAETNASNGADDDYSFYCGALSGRFEFIGHDHDTLFGLGEGARSATSNFFDMTQDGDVLEPLVPLFGTASQAANLTLRREYYIALRELANTVFAEPGFSAFVDNHLQGWVPNQERTAIKNYVASRIAALEAAINADSSVTVPPYVPPTPTSMSTFTSAAPSVRINEVLARNVAAHAHAGTFPDAIEIFNAGAGSVDLGGMRLTDDPAVPDKFVFPVGTILEAGGHLVVYADSETGAPGLHTMFALSQEGDEIRLYSSTGTLIDALKFGPQAADLSLSRTGAAQDVWALTSPTLGAANGAPVALGNLSGIRINELLSNPDYLSGDDFLEIYNPANQPVALGGVIVTDDFVNYPTRSVLPPLSFIGPQGYTLLRPEGENADPTNPSELPFKFSSFGTWAAIMGSNGATIDRFDADTLPPDVSISRVPDGSPLTAAFGLPTHIPTPGGPNIPPPAEILALLNQLRVTEVLYRPNNLEFVELQNIGETPLDISGVRFTQGLTYTFPEGTVLAPREIIVVCRDRAAFVAQFGEGVPLAPGQFSGTLDNSGETIALQPPPPWDVNILRFRYEPTWYAETSNDHSLEVDDVTVTLARDWDEKETWFASAAPLGTPGSGPPPVITGSLVATGILNDPFAYQILAKRIPDTYSATGLPAGLSINTETGLISGSPTQIGQFEVTIGASNATGGDTDTLSITITETGPLAGFEWSGISAAQLEAEPFDATLRAVDAGGRTITSFNSPATTTVRQVSGKILITEVGATTPTPDYFELQNVGSVPVNTAGWFVVTKAGSQSSPSADLNLTWALPNSVAAGQIIGATDAGSLAPTETPYGGQIDFPNGGEPGWVMVVDNQGVVRDFVCWGYSAAEIQGINFNSNGFNISVGSEWSGNGIPAAPANQSQFRTGSDDTNSANDWVLAATPNPRGTQNLGITVPFPSTFMTLTANGVGAINIVDGVWNGPITVNALSSAAELHAEIPGQPLARSATFAIISTNSNRPPSFTKGANQTIVEDSGGHAVPGWATNISPGPPSESSQTVSFLVSNDNPTLFAGNGAPTVAPNGLLTFTPAPDAFGTSTVTVRARDTGGTADGGQDTSAPQTFTITVLPQNDEPTVTLIGSGNVTVGQTAGPVAIPWASSVTPGPPNESGQLVVIELLTNNNSLFEVPPTVSTNGVLTFEPNPALSGTAIVTATVVDDGGTANGGDNTSQRIFTITITSLNDPPSFASGGDVIAGAGTAYSQPWAMEVSPGPGEIGQNVFFTVSGNDNPSLFLAQPAVAPNGLLTFTAGKNAGTANVTVFARDTGPNNPSTGDNNTSESVTFKIVITHVSTAAGKYRGLVTPPPPGVPTHGESGVIELKAAAKGSFSGKVRLGGKNYGFAGSFDNAGTGSFGRKGPSLTIVRKGQSPLTLTLQTDLAADTREVHGELKEGTNLFAQFVAQRDAYHPKTNPPPAAVYDLATHKGTFTAAFEAQAAPNGGLDEAQFPQGDGWTSVRVTKSGTVSLRGQLADGTRFTYASALDAENRFPLYIAAYKGLGSVLGPVAFATGSETTLNSSGLTWFRPPQLAPRPAPQYPNGWPDGIAVGFDGAARFVVTERNVLPYTSAVLELAGGTLSPAGVTQPFEIGAKNVARASGANSQKVSVRLKPTGEWSGSFVHPVTQKKTQIQGVILRHRNGGTGFFLGGDQSGHAVINAAP